MFNILFSTRHDIGNFKSFGWTAFARHVGKLRFIILDETLVATYLPLIMLP